MKDQYIDVEVEVDSVVYRGTRIVTGRGRHLYQTVRYGNLSMRDTHEYKSTEKILMPGMAKVLLAELVRRADGLAEVD